MGDWEIKRLEKNNQIIMEQTLLNSHESHAVCNVALAVLEEQRLYQAVNLLQAKVTLDGKQWCCLMGENLQEGISGFGDTPYLAMQDFYNQLHVKAA
jgi:hypothetical protein